MQICFTPEGRIVRNALVKGLVRTIAVTIVVGIIVFLVMRGMEWSTREAESGNPDPYRAPKPPTAIAQSSPPPPAVVATPTPLMSTRQSAMPAQVIAQPTEAPKPVDTLPGNSTRQKLSVQIPSFGRSDRITVPRGYAFQATAPVSLKATTPDITTTFSPNSLIQFNEPVSIEFENTSGQGFRLEYWIWSIKGNGVR